MYVSRMHGYEWREVGNGETAPQPTSAMVLYPERAELAHCTQYSYGWVVRMSNGRRHPPVQKPRMYHRVGSPPLIRTTPCSCTIMSLSRYIAIISRWSGFFLHAHCAKFQRAEFCFVGSSCDYSQANRLLLLFLCGIVIHHLSATSNITCWRVIRIDIIGKLLHLVPLFLESCWWSLSSFTVDASG